MPLTRWRDMSSLKRFVTACVALVAIDGVASALASPAEAAIPAGHCYDPRPVCDFHETVGCVCEHVVGRVPDDCHLKCLRIGK